MMSDTYSFRNNFPFLLGAILAINAIPDARLMLDASDCVMSIPEFQKNHDLNSSIIAPNGFHRVYHTEADVNLTASNRTEAIARSIMKLANSGEVKALFLSSVPMTIITGYQYDKIMRGLKTPLVPIIEIPRKGLLGDWLDGYATALKSLANHISPSASSPDPRKTAVVGYLMDRSEEDHMGNIRELERVLREALGLDPVSIWLSNRSFEKTASLDNVGTVVSLPYARDAARIVAEKYGARLIETMPPIGIEGTREWISQIARAVGEENRADEFIDRELREHIPKLEWAVNKWFAGKRIVYCGDPYLMSGVKSLVEELGCSFDRGVIFSERDKLKNTPDDSAPDAYELQTSAFIEKLKSNESNRPTDLFIANSIAAREIRSALGRDVPIMEFGYPSYSHHALYDAPFMGFRGAMCFISRMANRIAASKIV